MHQNCGALKFIIARTLIAYFGGHGSNCGNCGEMVDPVLHRHICENCHMEWRYVATLSGDSAITHTQAAQLYSRLFPWLEYVGIASGCVRDNSGSLYVEELYDYRIGRLRLDQTSV